MTPLPIKSLVNWEFEPCTICKGNLMYSGYDDDGLPLLVECTNCRGIGIEPVAVKNPVIGYKNPSEFRKDLFEPRYQLKSGEGFRWCADCDCLVHPTYRGTEHDLKCNIIRFLTLRPRVEGDNSIMLVVPNG